MKQFVRKVASLALALALACLPVRMPALAAQSGMVRVHLTKLGTLSALSLTTTCEYYVNQDRTRKIPSGASVKIGLSGGNLSLSVGGGAAASMGAKFTLSRGRPGNFGIRFTSPSQSNLFCGDLQLSAASGAIKPVLNIFIEDYLYGVIGYEMSDEYQMEALKAQAVASRCLAIGNQKTTGTHDVTDNTYSQVFKGFNPKLTNVIKAVDATRGVTAYYGGKVAILYYADSNGGQIESTKNVWGNTLGYSVVKDDPYDLEYPKASVKRLTVPKRPGSGTKIGAALIAAMADGLKAKGLKTGASNVTITDIQSVEGIDPKYPAPSRTWKRLRFTCAVRGTDAAGGSQRSATVTADLETYGHLKNNFGLALQSTNIELFTARDEGDSFVIESRRWGHGIGMSQCGAQWMAKQYGKSARDILTFYFPGIELRTVSYQDMTPGASEAAPTPPPIEPEPQPEDPSDGDEIQRPAALRLLKPGSRGEDVLLLQKRLLQLGFFSGSPAGNFQSQTEAAVKRIQYQLCISRSGRAEPELQRVIYAQSAPGSGAGRAPLMLRISCPTGLKAVDVRASASSSSRLLGRLADGREIRVLSISGKWCKISVSGKSGYVDKRYIHFP